MSDDLIKRTETVFDSIKHTGNGTEYWYARELAEALGYKKWENFEKVIIKAKISVTNAGIPVENHFLDTRKMVSIGYGNNRTINDIKLSRYACYVVAQNGDAVRKPLVAEAQSYFAYQTSRQEQTTKHDEDIKRLSARYKFTESDKRLSGAVMEQGIGSRGLGRIKNEGSKALFDGNGVKEMRKRYGVEEGKPLANKAPNVVLAGMSFANELTAKSIEELGLGNVDAIADEHVDSNKEVRQAMLNKGFAPEGLEGAEDTEKIMRRITKEDKKKAIEE